MPTYSSIVQYVPDDVRGERINIGVVVFGAGRTLVHFLKNWSRVRQFAPADVVSNLKEFARQAKQMNEQSIRAAAERWTYGVQFTNPAGSLLNDEALLLDAASRFLIDPAEAVARGYMIKSDLAKLARRRVREALVGRLGGAAGILLKEDHSVFGGYGPHSFDLAVANGHTLVAADAVSFQVPDAKKVDKDASAAAWAIRDVRKVNPQLPLAVIVALPQNDENGAFEAAAKAYLDEGAEIIQQNGLDGWAQRVTATITLPGQ